MIDQTDRRILDELARDAGLTSALLGERVGLSPSAAHRRVRLLEQRGLIDGYRARLSKAARGNPSIVFVEVTLSGQSRQVLGEFEQAIKECNEITEAHLMGDRPIICSRSRFAKATVTNESTASCWPACRGCSGSYPCSASAR